MRHASILEPRRANGLLGRRERGECVLQMYVFLRLVWQARTRVCICLRACSIPSLPLYLSPSHPRIYNYLAYLHGVCGAIISNAYTSLSIYRFLALTFMGSGANHLPSVLLGALGMAVKESCTSDRQHVTALGGGTSSGHSGAHTSCGVDHPAPMQALVVDPAMVA